MTTIINYITINFTSSNQYSAISNGMAVIAVILLLVFLVEKVLFDAYENGPIKHKTQAFLIVTLPFLIAMTVAIFLRMAQILKL
jgi:hypothetical protein